MSEIYKLLIKHFVGDASVEEEQRVFQYKNDHPKEYDRIEKMWYDQLSNVKDMNHEKAWKIVKAKASTGKVKSLFGWYRQIAAAAIVIMAIGSFIYYNSTDQNELIVLQNELETPQEFTLPDGSVVHLNAMASMTYPKTFNGDIRQVELTGEAFFEVQRDTTKPFVINTVHSDITVLGTSFNVNTSEDHTTVNVTTGKVKVQSNMDDSSMILLPGDMAIASTKSLNKSQVKNQNYLSWKTGVFDLDNMPVAEVIKELNSYYNNRIELKNTLSSCRISTTFSKMDLSTVADIIATTCNLEVKENNGNYELH